VEYYLMVLGSRLKKDGIATTAESQMIMDLYTMLKKEMKEQVLQKDSRGQSLPTADYTRGREDGFIAGYKQGRLETIDAVKGLLDKKTKDWREVGQ
jgi:hypothetical protein